MAGSNLVEVEPQITPATIVHALTDEMERCWRIRSVFSPSLDYQEAGENHKTDHLAENDLTDSREPHPLIDSMFAWNRTHVSPNEQVGPYAGIMDRSCESQNAIVATAPGEFTLNFRGYFSDAQTMEAFEIGYYTGRIFKDINVIVAESCDLDGDPTGVTERYSIEWDPITGLDWSLGESNWMSLEFTARITGTFRFALTQGDDFCLPKPILKFHFNALTE